MFKYKGNFFLNNTILFPKNTYFLITLNRLIFFAYDFRAYHFKAIRTFDKPYQGDLCNSHTHTK